MNIPTTGLRISGPSGDDTLELKELLGHGSFGVVYRALDTKNNTIYAVKFPQITGLGGTDELTALLNEVHAAARIKHHNVANVVHVEASSTNSLPYIVMEYLEDGTLQSRLDEFSSRGMTPNIEWLRVLINGLVDGIDAINAVMLHRDLKPDNILMSGNVPKIADFGLSKVIGAATRTQTFKGGQHLHYMAPEGWKYEANRIQLDMYAMGIVIFQAATLQYPYNLPARNMDIEAIRDMHLYQNPKSVQALRSDLPIGLSHIVARLLEKRPQDRFGSWNEVKQALTEAWRGQTDASSSNTAITSLLSTTQQLHDVATRSRLEAAKQEAEQLSQRQLDVFSFKKLLALLDGQIAEFNRQSTLGRIAPGWTDAHLASLPNQGSAYVTRIMLPHGGKINFSSFWIQPPMRLKIGEVRYAVFLEAPSGAGFNYLLCRSDPTDLYGNWMVCKARNHALVSSNNIRRSAEPFGFNDGTDWTPAGSMPSIRHIDLADKAMHVYTVGFSSDVVPAFLELVQSAMR